VKMPIESLSHLELNKFAPDNPPVIDRIKIFISFDIVGSTYHKQHSGRWQHVFDEFQQRINDRITDFNKAINKAPGSKKCDIRIWKRLGDEVIYETDIVTIKYLIKVMNLSFGILHGTAAFLESKGPHLSLKGTAWICPIDGVNNVILEGKNDFIGKHIDEGFRVSANFAKRRQLAVSYELAYLIAHYHDQDSFTPFYFLGYRQLKGVWSNKYYPVIWYSNHFEDSSGHLPYDEREKCDLIKLLEPQCQKSGKEVKKLLQAIEKEVHFPASDKLLHTFMDSDIEGKGWNVFGICCQLEAGNGPDIGAAGGDEPIFQWVDVEALHVEEEQMPSGIFVIQHGRAIAVKIADLG